MMTESTHGEIYVGAYLLRVGALEGAHVATVAPELRPHPAPRRSVQLLPPPIPTFVDRVVQVEAAVAALAASRPVEFFGAEGAGKSALLAHLAHHVVLASHPGGVVYLSARGARLEDVVQALFEALFESASPIKVAAPALRQLVSGESTGAGPVRAVVLFDDVELEPEGVEALVVAAPSCALVFASSERHLWGEGRADALEGLDPEVAAGLYERGLGRPLEDQEREAARGLASALGGRPLSIALAAGTARAEGLSPEEVMIRVAAAGSVEGLAILGLTGDERRMAGALAALGGVEAAVDDLAAIAARVPAAEADVAPGGDARAALDGLARRGVARRAGNRFGMAATLVAETRRRIDLSEAERTAAARYAEEAGRRGGDPEWVVAKSVALIEVLERAAAARRWRDVLALARAIEGGYALAGRWGAWEHVLELALQAARYAEDASAEAWALHQRGTRALCLGAADAALENLEDALVLREALGDVAGAAASRHNLEHVPGGAVLVGAPPPAPPALVQRAGPSPWFFLALALAAIALVTIVILAVVGRDEELEDSVFVVATSPVEYGSRVIGVTTDPRVIVIENGSDLPALVRAVRIQGGAASDFVVLRDDCTGRTLAPAEGCSIVAAFVPAAVGPRVADLVLDSEQGVRTVILSGVGATALPANEVAEAASSAPLEVTPARVDFGGQVTGTTGGPLPITFVNRSAGNARPVIRLDAGPSREFAIVEDLCTNSVVPPGQACIVEVVFRPRGGGLRGAVMIVRDATTNENWTVALTGRGEAETGDAAQEAPAPGAETPGPAAGFALAGPDMIAFGVQQPGTQSTVQTVTLENELDDEIRISNVRLSGLDARSFGIANDRCSGSILRPGGRCALDVWFLPDDEGEQRTSLVVRDGRGGVARETVITGTGG